MKGLVYGRGEYRTVLRDTAESAETRRLSSRTSAERDGMAPGVKGARAISSFQLPENSAGVFLRVC